jgi:hypothetical protein
MVIRARMLAAAGPRALQPVTERPGRRRERPDLVRAGPAAAPFVKCGGVREEEDAAASDRKPREEERAF